jgi:hypothetical protein
MFEEKQIHRKWFLRASPLIPCIHAVMHGIALGQGGVLSFGEKFGFMVHVPLWGIWISVPLTGAFFWFFYKNLASQAVRERLKRVNHLDAGLIGMAKQQSWTKLEARIQQLSKELKPYDVKLLQHWIAYQRSYYRSEYYLNQLDQLDQAQTDNPSSS